MKIIVATAIFIFSFSNFSLASCIDDAMLSLPVDKNNPIVSVLTFPRCIYDKECNLALKELKKVKKYGELEYLFYKACALANGECLNKDLIEAEKLLVRCSSQSRIGRSALLSFYLYYAENRKQYENLALSLASEGDKTAMGYLALLYRDENTEPGISKSYFWTKVLSILYEKKLNRLMKTKEQSAKIDNERSSIVSSLLDVQQALKMVSSRLDNETIKKLNVIAVNWENSLRPQSIQDPLSVVSQLYYLRAPDYSEDGEKLQQITPPEIPKTDRIQEYENSVLALLG